MWLAIPIYKSCLCTLILTLPSLLHLSITLFLCLFLFFLFLFRIIHTSITSDMVFPLTHVVGKDISRQRQLQITDALQTIVFMHVCIIICNPSPLAMRQGQCKYIYNSESHSVGGLGVHPHGSYTAPLYAITTFVIDLKAVFRWWLRFLIIFRLH